MTRRQTCRPTSLTISPALGKRDRGRAVTVGGMRLRVVAEASGISSSYLSLLFRGRRPNPTIDVLVKVANALGVGLDDLNDLLTRLQTQATAGSRPRRGRRPEARR